MTDSYRLLYQGQPGTSASTVYTPGGTKSAIVKHMSFANPTVTDRTLTVYRNGSADANLVFGPVTILAGGSGEWDGTVAFAAADTLDMKASAAAAITVTVDGDEIS
jgi:hypothetical protein